jgi:hypothetical protein
MLQMVKTNREVDTPLYLSSTNSTKQNHLWKCNFLLSWSRNVIHKYIASSSQLDILFMLILFHNLL